MRGTITTIKRGKPDQKFAKGCGSGFGFIKDEDGEDRFFAHNSVDGGNFDDLKEGLAVEFEPYEMDGRGLRARSVTVVS
jgi:cold shock CspA family protein